MWLSSSFCSTIFKTSSLLPSAVKGLLLVVLWVGEDNLLDGWKELAPFGGTACGSR